MRNFNRPLAAAISKDRMARQRRAYWKGGQIDENRQSQDVLKQHQTVNTSGDPGTLGHEQEERADPTYAAGGVVEAKPFADGGEVPKVPLACGGAVPRKMAAGGEVPKVPLATGGEPPIRPQGYATGGQVQSIDETRPLYAGGGEVEEDAGDDVVKMARNMKRRSLRRYG